MIELEPVRSKDILLACKEVWKLFRSKDEIIYALRNVSLTAAAGELICVTGPSGSGKSTLLNILGALESPTTGDVTALGVPYSSMDPRTLAQFRRRYIGHIFQELGLISHLTALENVELPYLFVRTQLGDLKHLAQEALTRVGVDHRASHMPSQLSAGERQRVAIARSILGKQKILMADEPTANLDWKRGSDVIAILRGLADEGRSILLATHDERIQQMADKVWRLEDGIVKG